MDNTDARKEFSVEDVTINGEQHVIIKVEHFYNLFGIYMESKGETLMVDWANHQWDKLSRTKKKRIWNKKAKQLITMMYHFSKIKIEEDKDEKTDIAI